MENVIISLEATCDLSQEIIKQNEMNFLINALCLDEQRA